MRNYIKEFKEFALNGNMIELILGITLASSFTKIINSFVDDFFMPLFSVLTGNINFSKLSWVFYTLREGNQVIVSYGLLINASVNFLIVAFAIFIGVKIFYPLKTKQKEYKVNKKNEELIILKEIKNILELKLKK